MNVSYLNKDNECPKPNYQHLNPWGYCMVFFSYHHREKEVTIVNNTECLLHLLLQVFKALSAFLIHM